MSRRQAEISQSVYISKIHLIDARPLINMPPLNERYNERFVRPFVSLFSPELYLTTVQFGRNVLYCFV